MDKNQKNQMKQFISTAIDLNGGRFKDEEITHLHDLVENRDEYDGKSKTYKNHFTDRYSGGKYTRDEETTFTFRSDDDGIRIIEHYESHDDDGEEHMYDNVHKTGRDILRNIHKIF